MTGGSFSTLLDGVTPLLTVSAALLSTVLSVGASSFTLASKRALSFSHRKASFSLSS